MPAITDENLRRNYINTFDSVVYEITTKESFKPIYKSIAKLFFKPVAGMEGLLDMSLDQTSNWASLSKTQKECVACILRMIRVRARDCEELLVRTHQMVPPEDEDERRWRKWVRLALPRAVFDALEFIEIHTGYPTPSSAYREFEEGFMDSIAQAIRFYKDAAIYLTSEASAVARVDSADEDSCSSPGNNYGSIMKECPMLFELLYLLLDKYNSSHNGTTRSSTSPSPRTHRLSGSLEPTGPSLLTRSNSGSSSASYSNEKSHALHLGSNHSSSMHSAVFRSVPHCQIRSLDEDEFTPSNHKSNSISKIAVISPPSNGNAVGNSRSADRAVDDDRDNNDNNRSPGQGLTIGAANTRTRRISWGPESGKSLAADGEVRTDTPTPPPPPPTAETILQAVAAASTPPREILAQTATHADIAEAATILAAAAASVAANTSTADIPFATSFQSASAEGSNASDGSASQ
jgi:hypothetical protein